MTIMQVVAVPSLRAAARKASLLAADRPPLGAPQCRGSAEGERPGAMRGAERNGTAITNVRYRPKADNQRGGLTAAKRALHLSQLTR